MTPRVLLIDDDPLLCDLTTMFFKAEGFEFESLSEGKDAVKTVEEWLPEAVILDLNLPDMSGLDLLGELQAWSDVIVLSGDRDPATVKTAFEHGAKDYVAKPFMPAELVWRCQTLLMPKAA